MGGGVEMESSSGWVRNTDSRPLAGVWLTGIDLVGTNVVPEDLARLKGLSRLKALHLPGPIWNRNADGGKQLSRELGHLSGIHTLQKLTFSYHFLDTIRFKDEGLEAISELTDLRELVLRQTAVKGHALAPFRRLESLDVTLSQFDDEGLSAIADLRTLRRLRLGDTFITDEGAAALADLSGLIELDLHGTNLSDPGLVNLRSLRGLRKLNLMGTGLTDVGLDYLQGLTAIEELNLYRTKISNAGLAKLHGLTSLREIDLRYTRVTQAGVERLRAALPSARVVFLDVSLRPPRLSQNPEPPVAGDDESVAAWARKWGGEASLQAGRLVSLSLLSTAMIDTELAHLKNLPDLRKLDLGATEVGDLGLQYVAELRGLRELRLDNTTVSDQGLRHLAGLTNLKKTVAAEHLCRGRGTFPSIAFDRTAQPDVERLAD